MTLSEPRQLIRQQIRQRRRQLSVTEQELAGHAVKNRLQSLLEQSTIQRVALYLSVDGELSTRPLIELCWALAVDVYLPVLHPFSQGHLLFLKYTPQTQLIENRFKIQEPKLNCLDVLPPAQLNILFTPLVAFDASGNRLGMGGGFYDRTFATLPEQIQRIGLAHDLQYYPQLPIAEWDQPLDQIITPSKSWDWSTPLEYNSGNN
ncbi:5-formyltetrahydrofolate cyclo-ligase [Celerinatantimonas sp. YJH-8]|uniref:5-formyltetrahydrofolate cyclo-ligase n=1 Tax=Celerinatantimonas sp. YJH-8 TaxID=3228714 RepID=UPI0038C5B22B